MLTRERNALYCKPSYRDEVWSLLSAWCSYEPLTTNERGLIAEAYQDGSPASEIARAVYDARRARAA